MAEVIWNKQAETDYYIESSDTIRIIDVWDSRREPLKLEKRIKTK